MKSEIKAPKKIETDKDLFFAELGRAHELHIKNLPSGAHEFPEKQTLPRIEILKQQPYKNKELIITTIPTQMKQSVEKIEKK